MKLEKQPNLTLSFHENKAQLLTLISQNNTRQHHLRALLYSVENVQHAESFIPVLSSWLSNNLPFNPISDGFITVQQFIDIQAYESLLLLLGNRFKYRLIPTMQQLSTLLDKFTLLHLSENLAKDLDNAYKVYALMVYYNLVPTIETYSRLVSCGIYGKSDEGLRRSLITFKEQNILGLVPSVESVAAVAYCQFLKSNYTDSIDLIKSLNSSNSNLQTMLAVAQAKAGLLDDAKVTMMKTDVTDERIFGCEFWPTRKDLL